MNDTVLLSFLQQHVRNTALEQQPTLSLFDSKEQNIIASHDKHCTVIALQQAFAYRGEGVGTAEAGDRVGVE